MPATPVHLHVTWIVLLTLAPLALLTAAALGLTFGTRFEPRQVPILFGIIVLPLTFLSGAFMQLSLAPDWIQTIAKYNPVNWAVEAGREAVSSSVDWGFVLGRLGLLAALAIACVLLATRAFRSYQRSA